MKVDLRTALAEPASKRRYNQRLFATIAERYDLITRLLSFGRDQAWKRRVISLAGIGPLDQVLDLACGTGDLALMAAARGATVTGLDLTPKMLTLAAARARGSRACPPRWCAGDICALPVADASATVVTAGYGLRNVPDLPTALAEIHRALAAGGRVVALDFDKPSAPWLRAVYLGYLNVVGGALGWILHRDPDTYRYIPASIRRYPGAAGVAAMMREAGFRSVRHVPVFGGFMAIHVAEKGAE